MILASCASTKSDKIVFTPLPPVLVQPDSYLSKLCDLPIDLGDKALTQEDVERFWITDRVHLVECYKRHKAIRDFFKERDNRITGTENNNAR